LRTKRTKGSMKMPTRVVAALLALVIVATGRLAWAGPERVGRLPHGVVRVVETAGAFAFVGNGAELQIIDLSTPESPVVVGGVTFDSDIRTLAVDDGRVYVGTLDDLRIIDVGDPAAPAELGVLPLFGGKHAMGASGELVCIAGGSGVTIVDVSDPASPSAVGEWSGAVDLEVVGRYAYILTSGLRVIDLIDPSNPTEVGYVDVVANSLDLKGSDLFAAGDYRITVFSLAHPIHPQTMGMMYLPIGHHANDIAVSGNLAYLVTSIDSFDVGLLVVDIESLSSMTLKGTVTPPVERPREWWVAVAAIANHGIVATDDHGIRIIEATDPTDPSEVAVVDAPGYTVGGAVAGGILVTANHFRGVRTVDITNPSAPQELAILEPGPWWPVADVDLDGSMGVAVGRSLAMMDFSDPTSPVVVGEIDDWTVQGAAVEIVDDLAYVADPEFGLRVISIADPTEPVEIGSLTLPWVYPEYLDADGALVVLQGQYVEVVSVADPLAPVSLAIMGVYAGQRGIALEGSTLYIAGGGWFRIFDLSDPGNPVETSARYAPRGLSPIRVADSTAYLGVSVPDGPYTIEVWDVDDPNDPFLRETYAGVGWVRDFAIAGNHVVSTRYNSGIDLIEHLPGPLFSDDFESGDTSAWSSVAHLL